MYLYSEGQDLFIVFFFAKLETTDSMAYMLSTIQKILDEARSENGDKRRSHSRDVVLEASASAPGGLEAVFLTGLASPRPHTVLPRSWLGLVFDILFTKLLCSVFH